MIYKIFYKKINIKKYFSITNMRPTNAFSLVRGKDCKTLKALHGFDLTSGGCHADV
jgi:hypothetical protein